MVSLHKDEAYSQCQRRKLRFGRPSLFPKWLFPDGRTQLKIGLVKIEQRIAFGLIILWAALFFVLIPPFARLFVLIARPFYVALFS
jgi:hypothetical protein